MSEDWFESTESRLERLEAEVSVLFSLLSKVSACLRERREMVALQELALEQGGVTVSQATGITGSEKRARRLLRQLCLLGMMLRRGEVYLPAVRLRGMPLLEEIARRELAVAVESIKREASLYNREVSRV